ncbi:MAG TPA: histidine phosphatase family protein [Acidimicrobiales bacterium]|nr:histidine phosphatase family protein [Acidimicrobiales bacterium]
MARVVLVRHGRAAAGFGEHADPGLDDVGRAQARAMAAAMASWGPMPIVSSPLARARQTAEPLEALWDQTATVEPAVGEIPTPAGVEVAERPAWLRAVLGGRWTAVVPGSELGGWRDRLVEALISLEDDTIVTTHFVAINVAVAVATGDDRMTVFHPDHCSRTVLDTSGARLALVELGGQAETEVR